LLFSLESLLVFPPEGLAGSSLFAGIIALPATLNIFTRETRSLSVLLEQRISLGPLRIPAEIALTWPESMRPRCWWGEWGLPVLHPAPDADDPWSDLFKALRSCGSRRSSSNPRHDLRYLMLLGQIVRTCIWPEKPDPSPQKTSTEQKWIAGQMGVLFGRSLELSGEVHRP